MAEPHLPGEVDQPGRDRGQCRIGLDAELVGGPPHQHRIADGLGRRHREQQPGRWRERFQPPPEAVLDPARQRRGVGQPEAARQLPGRQITRQFQQGERVSAGLGHDPVADSFVHRAGDHGQQQGARLVLDQPGYDQLGQPGQVTLGGRLAHREDQDDRLGRQAARDERERLRRGLVEPLRVVHHAYQRLLLGDVGQQAQQSQPDQEAVGGVAGLQAERRAERVALWSGQAIEPVEERRTQLVQPSEREFHLGLDADRPGGPASGRASQQVAQQRGLANARLAAQHQSPAVAGPRTG